jgi:hypothetical protein
VALLGVALGAMFIASLLLFILWAKYDYKISP